MNFLRSKEEEAKKFFETSERVNARIFYRFLADFFSDVIDNAHIKNKSSNKVKKSNYDNLYNLFEEFYGGYKKDPITKNQYKNLGNDIVNNYLKTVQINDSSVEFEGIDSPTEGVVVDQYGNGDKIGLNLYDVFNLNKSQSSDKNVAARELSKRLVKVMNVILNGFNGYYIGVNSNGAVISINWEGLSVN